MAETIPLIENVDGFEAVRNAIANIIALESLSQQALATAASEDPDLWELNVYTERTNPWETMRDGNGFIAPVVNVWYETSSIIERQSTVVQQVYDSTFNVDCYGYGISQETLTGHTAGDESAILEAQRAARIVRQILQHPKYNLLGLGRSVVGTRSVQRRQSYRPNGNEGPIEKVMAVNLQLSVTHVENVPFKALGTYESALVEVRRTPEGAVLAQYLYDWSDD